MRKKLLFIANTGFNLYNFRINLIRYLRGKGCEIIAIANDEADFSKNFQENDIKFISIPIDHKGKNPLNDILLIKSLVSLYKKESPDLVHHFTIKPCIFGSIAAKIAKIPVVVNTITGLGYVFDRGGFLQMMVENLYKFAFSGNVNVIFQNEENKNLFLKKQIIKTKEKVHVILGSGINTERYTPGMKIKKEKGVYFLLIARMLWSKGIKEFVEAAERVKKQYPDVKFVMVGGYSGGGAEGNPDMVPEKWLIDKKNKGAVDWLGRLPHEEVISLLDKADVVVLPSYYPEGIPFSLIEAAAKAKPIITTNAPGCREVVKDGENGFLVPPKNIPALEKAMLEFIKNPQLIDKMGIESRKRAVHIFDEKIVFEQVLQVYRKAGFTI